LFLLLQELLFIMVVAVAVELILLVELLEQVV
jgi:hypothetical protein